ncbi:MAG TPA: hypothetical protein VHB98_11860, partial [Chloroflexota bacterium]|nr:hypothetical protein [Chloroflexota bacterium]
MYARITRRTLGATVALAVMAGSTTHGMAQAGSATVRIGTSAHLASISAEGLAVLGSRYAYIGSSTSNTMYVLDLGAGHSVRWTLPNIQGGQGYAYGMEQMALSPDNRTLYFGNLVRGDVVALDVTGRKPLREILLGSPDRVPVGLEVSADNRYLYVQGGNGTDVYDAASGNEIGSIPTADRIAPASDGTLYGVSFSAGHIDVHVYDETGNNGRLLAGFDGNTLAQKNGSIALSPDGRRLYVLWNGLRALDPRTGRQVGMVTLPLEPSYTGMALAPNGQQAMLWAPDIAGWYETPTDNPQYIYTHYGFVAGG